MSADGNGRLLDAEEVAARLNVPVSWVHRAAREGRLPAIKLGRYTRFDPADVDRWIATQKDAPAPHQPAGGATPGGQS